LIEESNTASRKGMTKVGEVAEAFRSLSRDADALTGLAKEVQTGSLDQARLVEGITGRIEQMKRVTEGATASAVATAREGEQLRDEAANLGQMAQQFAAGMGVCAD
jgi:methyl-accepting chemotaxis protein